MIVVGSLGTDQFTCCRGNKPTRPHPTPKRSRLTATSPKIQVIILKNIPSREYGMAEHPNKHIRAAIRYAEENGWEFVKAGPRSHDFGTLYCQHRERDGCIVRVYSTPKHPEDHARWIRRQVDRCPH